MKRRLFTTAGLAAAALLTLSGCGDTTEPEVLNLSGVWSGSWLSAQAGQGDVVVVLNQSGAEITGSMQIEGNICSPDSLIEGTFDDVTHVLTLRLRDPNDVEHSVALTGNYRDQTDTIALTFVVENWEICTGGTGSMEFARN